MIVSAFSVANCRIQAVMDIFIKLMRLWPLWLVIIAGIVLVKRAICKHRQARGPCKPEALSESVKN